MMNNTCYERCTSAFVQSNTIMHKEHLLYFFLFSNKSNYQDIQISIKRIKILNHGNTDLVM